jgi:hypothetical protein
MPFTRITPGGLSAMIALGIAIGGAISSHQFKTGYSDSTRTRVVCALGIMET